MDINKLTIDYYIYTLDMLMMRNRILTLINRILTLINRFHQEFKDTYQYQIVIATYKQTVHSYIL